MLRHTFGQRLSPDVNRNLKQIVQPRGGGIYMSNIYGDMRTVRFKVDGVDGVDGVDLVD